MKKIILICCALLSHSSFAFEEALTFSELGVDQIFKSSPVDDPNAYQVENAEYVVKASPFHWVIPGPGSRKEQVYPQKSNSDVAIEFFENRLFMAFRTSPKNYASKKTRMYVISTGDGVNWDFEWKSDGASDTQDPQLLNYKGKLYFYHFSKGANEVLRNYRSGFQDWSAPLNTMGPGEHLWDMKIRNNVIWTTSYTGKTGKMKVQLKKSVDARKFVTEDIDQEHVYFGGVSEAGFEFDDEGNLWSVTKNSSGFGAHIAFAPSNLLSYWSMLSTDQGYQSPRMFRHGKELYLLARRHKGKKHYDWARRGGYGWRRFLNWTRYALTPKTTALYKLNQTTRQLELVMDLPGAGDTAFPAVRRVDAYTFLIANYTSSLERQNRSWIIGKLGRTKIYVMALKFEKVSKD